MHERGAQRTSGEAKKGGQGSPGFLDWATGSDEAENSRTG